MAKRSRLKQTVFSISLALIVVAVVEATLQILCVASPRVSELLGYASTVRTDTPAILDDPVTGYRPNPEYHDHDSRGFRNAKAMERVDVVCLGDSQTYGVGVMRDEAWPQQLSRMSGRTTYNMACGGWGPTQTETLLETAISLQPTLVVQALYSGNDLFDCYQMVYERRQAQQYVTSDLELKNQIDEANKPETLTDTLLPLFDVYVGRFGTPAEKPSKGTQPSGLRSVLSNHCRVYGLGRAVKRRLYPEDDLREFEEWQGQYWDYFRAKAESSNGMWEAIESAKWRAVFVPEYRLSGLQLNDPRIQEGQRIALASISSMNERLKKHQATLLVLLIPSKMSVFAEEVGENRQSGSFKKVVDNEERFWNNAKKRLDQEGIPTVDALPVLRESLRAGSQPFSITPDDHPNARGHRVIAEAVARWIKANTPSRN